MSCLRLGKKLRPASKAWKGFTSTLQGKLHKLKRSKPIKKTANRLNTTLGIVFNRSPSFPTPLQRKKLALALPPSAPRPHTHHKRLHLHQKFAPVYVHELFTEPISIEAKRLEPPAATTSKVIERQQLTKLEMRVISGPVLPETGKGDDASESVLGVAEMEGVDERAEQFISKFREEMRLQRQRSFGEYQEMLARGL